MGIQLDQTPTSFAVLAGRLRNLRLAAGQPSFSEIARRITAARLARGVPEFESRVSRTTVYDCFREDRKRVDSELILEIVRTLECDSAEISQWVNDLDAFQRRLAASAVVQVSDSLPPRLPGFVGRQEQMAQIFGNASTWISGMPGAGKTQLSLFAANELLDSGAVDGVLLADLRGFSPEGPPADPQAIVDGLLRLLGMNDRSGSAAARVERLHSELAATRVLLILDDAADPTQVSSILPTLEGIRTLVTSRMVPADVAGASAHSHVQLTSFPRTDSLKALMKIVGPDRITADMATADAILETTGDLPLAVRLTASRIASKPAWSLIEHLEFAHTRIQGLRLDDSLYQAFFLTYQGLDPDSQKLLRLLAVHPHSLFDRASIFALASGVVADPGSSLDALVQANFLTHPRPHRYVIHELLRLHAADLSLESDPPSWRGAAHKRLVSSLVARAWQAQRISKEAVSEVPRTPRFPLDPAQEEAAQFTAEQADEFFADSGDLLLSLALSPDVLSSNLIDDAHFLATISESAMGWLHKAGRFDDALVLFQEALRAAQRIGDLEGQVRAQVSLGATYAQMGRHIEAHKVLIGVDGIARDYPLEDLLLQNSLGVVLDLTDNHQEAEDRYSRALELAEQLGDLRRVGYAWNNLGKLFIRTGRIDECRQALEKSIEIAELTNDQVSIARSKINLASLLIDIDQPAEALEAALGAYDLAKELDMGPGILVSALNVGSALMGVGRHEDSILWHEIGLEWAERTGMYQHRIPLETNMATCLRLRGEHAQAAEWAFNSLTRCLEVNDPQLTQWAVEILSECLLDTSRLDPNHPEWAEVANLVAGVDSDPARLVYKTLFT